MWMGGEIGGVEGGEIIVKIYYVSKESTFNFKRLSIC